MVTSQHARKYVSRSAGDDDIIYIWNTCTCASDSIRNVKFILKVPSNHGYFLLFSRVSIAREQNQNVYVIDLRGLVDFNSSIDFVIERQCNVSQVPCSIQT